MRVVERSGAGRPAGHRRRKRGARARTTMYFSRQPASIAARAHDDDGGGGGGWRDQGDAEEEPILVDPTKLPQYTMCAKRSRRRKKKLE